MERVEEERTRQSEIERKKEMLMMAHLHRRGVLVVAPPARDPIHNTQSNPKWPNIEP